MPRNFSGVYSKPAGTTPTNGDDADATQFNLLMDDFVADLNTPRPVVAGGTGASDAATAVENLGFTTPAAGISQLSGRNLIINGSGRINQQGYVSGTATVVANKFTIDQWFVVTSGQNLTFTGTNAGRTMTAPAGGVAQVIEGGNVVGGTYVINWVGTSTCTVAGIARAKGDTFTLTANTNVTVKFSSGTFSEAQLEAGSVATPFERTDFGEEMAKCMRYWQSGFVGFRWNNAANETIIVYKGLPVRLRATPSISMVAQTSSINLTSNTVYAPNEDTIFYSVTASATAGWAQGEVIFSAEARQIV